METTFYLVEMPYFCRSCWHLLDEERKFKERLFIFSVAELCERLGIRPEQLVVESL